DRLTGTHELRLGTVPLIGSGSRASDANANAADIVASGTRHVKAHPFAGGIPATDQLRLVTISTAQRGHVGGERREVASRDRESRRPGEATARYACGHVDEFA